MKTTEQELPSSAHHGQVTAAATHPKLKELLRAGRTFDVHRAELGSPSKKVVVKQANVYADSVDAAARLNNEYSISRAIDSNRVVTATQWLDTTRGPLLVFPDDELSALSERPLLSVDAVQLLRLAVEIGEALDHVHRAGLIHRDINPSNIIASADLSDVRLIDFCIAIRSDSIDAQHNKIATPRGTLDYMAPEQSGRIDRKVDQRSDLYSLGVSLYQIATGQLPFIETQPAELIHRHLTEVAPRSKLLNPAIPQKLCDAIARLMQKNPEDRFQTTRAFVDALLDEDSHLGSDSFKLSTKLYGRESALQQALSSITRDIDNQKRSRFIRVVGPSGSGKSELVASLAGPMIEAGAFFVQGKFDQFDQPRPYGAFIQACDMLLRKLLSLPEVELRLWRKRLLDALSPNAQVLLDLLPDYVKLIDSQPKVPKLGLNESQIRMSLVFRRFVNALSSADRPLIIFLDDLQWADAASRSLIELLLSDATIDNLTIITAYRDNEVGLNHPLTSLFATLTENHQIDPPIKILPLHLDDIAQLVADSLGQTPEIATPLAQIILKKTAGNPFFIRQFLLALVRKKLVTYSPMSKRWTSHDQKVEAEQFTDNVASLVIERILDLPQSAQELVKRAACFGNTFSCEDLALTSTFSTLELEQQLAPALNSQIILLEQSPADSSVSHYRFQHDRVQLAAHGLLPEEQRSELHALIGRHLIQRGEHQGSRITQLTDHLVAGKRHLDTFLIHELHSLAIKSALRSKASNAYQATLHYLNIAEQALLRTQDSPDTEQLFAINIERAEAAYLLSNLTLAESLADEMLLLDLEPLDQVAVLELKTLIHTARLEYRDAIVAGRKAISLLGVELPANPKTATILAQIAKTKLKLRGRSDADILMLPAMQDPYKMAAMRVLKLLAPPAYFSEPNLLPIIAMTHVRLTVDYGSAPYSGYGFVVYGMMHCAVLGNIPRGLAYGKLALQMVSTPDASDIEGAVKMMFAGFIRHWSTPITEVLPIYLDGAEKAFSVGDLEFHAYNRYGHASYALMGGHSLEKVQAYLDHHIDAVTEAAHEKTQRIMDMARSSVMRMRGSSETAPSLFDSEESLRLWTEQSDATSLAYHYKYRLLESLMVGDYEAVLVNAEKMTANLAGILSMAYQPFYQFYEALALIETSLTATFSQRQIKLGKAKILLRRLSKWSKHSPVTLHHRVVLLRAELAAASGNTAKAIKAYEEAIDLARQSAALHDTGLFLERAGRFYLRQQSPAVAMLHLNASMDSHRVWGADAWADSVSSRFALFTKQHRLISAIHTSSTVSPGMNSVDSQSLMNAATALAQKSSLEEVIVEVMTAIVVNAGATRGALVLQQDGLWNLAAELQQGKFVKMLTNTLAASSTTLPHSIINFVRHANERLVLNDVTIDETFGNDPYVMSVKPSSVLCAPLVAKGKIVGIIYLENSALRNAFRADLCKSVEVLATQAAMSIDNASLFEKLEDALEKQVDLTSAHARFVPHSFLELLGRPSIADIKLGDHIKGQASILFSDMREFTSLIEQLTPDEAIIFINDYLSLMDPAVLAHGGFVDAYIGDALMAVFDRGPQAAIDAGIMMFQRLDAWDGGKGSRNAKPIKIGIGIATGELIFGTIGAANRLKCGVIGDTVNLASRIERLTKDYDVKILITHDTLQTLPNPEKYDIREIDNVKVAGREKPTRLYEVYNADNADLRAQKTLSAPYLIQGLQCYQSADLSGALKFFTQCVDLAPDDPVSKKLLARALEKTRANRNKANTSAD